MSGIQYQMHYRIIRKFKKAGAISEETSVTIEDAKLDLQEESWLNYFAGSFLGNIKKTKDNRYYHQKSTDYTQL